MIEAQILENHKIMVLKNAVSDSVKYETIKFSYPKSWKNYIKTAVFKNEKATVSVLMTKESPLCLSENECYIPHEVLSFPGFTVSVFGNEGDTLATTARGFVTVIKSGYEQGDTPKEPTESEYSQILSLINKTQNGDGVGRAIADGGEIFNDYEKNIASGSKSHAEGRRTQATNDYAHSEGDETLASGQSSHAEGCGTKTSGVASHAEGDTTVASGDSSHSEGAATKATGPASHSEGNSTMASGAQAHAEGDDTVASGQGSHSEGGSTEAKGALSHAEGALSVAEGRGSSARNHKTLAKGDFSSAEGESTQALGINAHSEGVNTVASGSNSHSEGENSQAVGRSSHSEGQYTEASGEASHAEGNNTEASGQFAHAEGYQTIASGAYSHAEGDHTIADSAAQTVVGRYNKSNPAALFIVGNGTSENRKNVFVVYGDGRGAAITEQGVSDSSVVRMDTLKKAVSDVSKDIPTILKTALTEAKNSGDFKGDKGDKGDDGYTPVKGVDYFTDTDVNEIIDRVEENINYDNSNNNEENIPEYWKVELDNGIEDINTVLCTVGRNKSAFLFYSDAHYDGGSRMSPRLLKYLYKNTGLTKTFYGGDIVNTESTNSDTMKYIWDWRKQVKDLPNHHSVVGNHDDGNAVNNLFSSKYIYGYLMAAEETPDIVRYDDMNYYIDSPNEKTRYIFLDTAYMTGSEEQRNFIASTLLSTPDNWHIIAIAHAWYQPDYTQSNVKPIPILPLNHNNSKHSYNICNIFDNYNSREKDNYGDYSNCNAKVEFCIGGHLHRDYIGFTDGGIPIITVETDGREARSNFTYAKGTITESSVSGIIIDYDANKLNVIYIGKGNSYSLNLSNKNITYQYRIINDLTNVSNSSNLTRIAGNSSYTATLNSADVIESVVITMGGVDITDTAYNTTTNSINITSVTGDIVITAKTTERLINLLELDNCESDYRINSSGSKVESTGHSVSNIIAFKYTDALYMSADIFVNDLNNCVISACNADGEPSLYDAGNGVYKVINCYINESWESVEALTSNNIIYAYKFTPSLITSAGAKNRWQDVTHILVTGNQFTNDSIITVNQPIPKPE